MRVLIRLLRLFAPVRWWLLLGVLLSLVTLIANVVLMAISGWFIAAMGLAGVAGVAMNYFTPAATIRACAIVRTAGRYGERLITHDATLRVLSSVRVWFYQRLQPLSPAQLQGYQSGDLLSRLRADIDTLDNAYLRIMLPMAVALIASLLFVLWLYQQAPQLALLEAGLLLLAGLLIPWWLARNSGHAGRQLVQRSAELRAGVIDGLQGLGELILYGADGAQFERLNRLGGRLGRVQLSMARWQVAGQAVVTLCAHLALWGVLVLLIPEISQGRRPPAELALFALFALASFEAIAPLPLAFQALQPTLTAARRIFSLVDLAPAVPDPDSPSPEPNGYGFHLDRVGFRYPGDAAATLHSLSFDIPWKTRTAIIGPTGAGKSTLLNLLLGFQRADAGEIRFAGHPLSRWRGDDLRSCMAVVDQQSHLFIGTIRDNLLLGQPAATDQQLEAACDTACVLDLIEALPAGFDSEVGEAATRLSGGEARRLAIARALLREAPVLILDEPTEGLDPVTASRLMQRLFDYCEQRTLIVITHQLNELPLMDQVILLEQGRLLACGSHDQLADQSADYQALLELAPIFTA